MSKVEVTKKELSEESSKFAQAAKKLKIECGHKTIQIKLLKRQNKDLRATDMWRTQKMERQAFEIWKLKLLLKEAGYDPQNLPQPKGLRIVSNPPNPPPTSGVNIPAPKRKRTESFGDDEEFNPHPKRRALSLTEFLKTDTYACGETYTQYLVDHQLGYDIPNPGDDMDLDEAGDYGKKLEEGAKHVENEKPENPASLFKEYLVKNNLPASRQLDDAKDMAIQMAKAQEQAQHLSKEDQRYYKEYALAVMRSILDAEQEKGKSKGGQGGDEAGEAIKDEDEERYVCAEEEEDEMSAGSEDGEEEGGTLTEYEDEEEASDEEEEEEDAAAEPDEEEEEEDASDEEEEEEEEDASDQEEENANDEEEEEEESVHESSELMDEEGVEGEVPVSEPSQTSDDSGEEEAEEAPVPEPFEYYSDDGEEAKAGSSPPKRRLSEFQLAIERSLHPATTTGEGVEKEAPATPAASMDANWGYEEARVSKPSEHSPAPKSAGYYRDIEEEYGIPKGKYSELELSVAMTLANLRNGRWEKEVERPTFRVGERPSEDYEAEEAPVPEPFEYYSDTEKVYSDTERVFDPRDPDF
ncbi:hypothetical protein B9Z19DRAFT_1094984 [Tuber borchii]|uniref:Uncharacterized protein n=1 Tax=Tuber borchii TaxID=42251 RepID=A0A2T6ZDG1_TUBBO|nr:hypothetical protein B9Z19DRAFT_1094984 [Tuber borchii]